jgi:hypothetical protein
VQLGKLPHKTTDSERRLKTGVQLEKLPHKAPLTIGKAADT